MQQEIWKEVPGYDGRYLVSSHGKVYSKYLNREVSLNDRGNGYLFVVLSRKGKKKNVFVHKLVAELFVGNPNNLKEVDHIDGNKTNNHYSNLRFVTHRENMCNPVSVKVRNEAIIKKQGVPIEVYKNGIKIAEYSCLMEAARNLNCCCTNISKHLRGIGKQVKGYVFKRVI